MEIQGNLRQPQLLLINTPEIQQYVNNTLVYNTDNVLLYDILIIPILILILFMVLYECISLCSPCISQCYNYCRFQINDKKGKLTGAIRRKLLEKKLLDKTIKLRMSPYVASLPTDYQQPIKEFNLHAAKPIQTVVQEHIITIPSNYITPK